VGDVSRRRIYQQRISKWRGPSLQTNFFTDALPMDLTDQNITYFSTNLTSLFGIAASLGMGRSKVSLCFFEHYFGLIFLMCAYDFCVC
jgi:hypothetical protein